MDDQHKVRRGACYKTADMELLVNSLQEVAPSEVVMGDGCADVDIYGNCH